MKLVDKILESKAKDSNADISEAQSQIDDLVYTLYALDSHEIDIIKN